MRGYILTSLLLVAIVGDARGQQDSAAARWPEIGSRVRISTAANRTVTGDLVNIRGDTLVIRTAQELAAQLRHIPVGKVELIPGSTVTRIEVSRGRGFQVERVIAGAALGAAAGLAFAGLTDVSAEVLFGEGAGSSVGYGEAAAVGAVAGAVLGAATPGDRWEQAERPTPPTFAPAKRVGRLRLTPSFR
jgi:hypothetical protein